MLIYRKLEMFCDTTKKGAFAVDAIYLSVLDSSHPGDFVDWSICLICKCRIVSILAVSSGSHIYVAPWSSLKKHSMTARFLKGRGWIFVKCLWRHKKKRQCHCFYDLPKVAVEAHMLYTTSPDRVRINHQRKCKFSFSHNTHWTYPPISVLPLRAS